MRCELHVCIIHRVLRVIKRILDFIRPDLVAAIVYDEHCCSNITLTGYIICCRVTINRVQIV